MGEENIKDILALTLFLPICRKLLIEMKKRYIFMMIIETAKGTCHMHTKVSHVHYHEPVKMEQTVKAPAKPKIEVNLSGFVDEILNLKL